MKNVLLFAFILLLAACSKDRRSNRAGHKMQDFIVELSEFARAQKPGFALIPQNGAELLFRNLDDTEELDDRLLSAIDGIGIEELFYNGSFEPDDYRLQMLLKARERIPVLVADYTSGQSDLDQSYVYNTDAGFLAFPRDSSNYDYIHIPTYVHQENANNITALKDAKNYLYLISDGGFSTKEDFLEAIRQTNFDVVLIDAFYRDNLFTSADISSLKIKANGGSRLVISYINVGAAEKYRYYWQEDWKLHHPRWLKKEYDGYADEIWVKYWKKDWKEIIYGNSNSYMQKIIDAGFDGAYLDNVEAFYFLYFDE
ncbi:MAG: endo alpha-1,4 polygalactosaminidase [Bacteroidota bacterium]